jgi:signal transduction histidine kinase
VLRPLRQIVVTTREISEANLHERLALTGPQDELTQLADTIDGLLERLEAAFDAQRRFVANAAHELRTPLTTMRATLDVAVAKPEGVPPQVRALDANLREELDQADRLLGGFLTLARAQHGQLAVAQLGQPFRQLGAERTGSLNGHGLGLSIVAAVATAHGGSVSLGARPEGGLQMQTTLPAAIATATAAPVAGASG